MSRTHSRGLLSPPYQGSWFSRDLLAGLTVWAVLVPEALAYATIAGVSPVVGLYAAPPALLLYAVFGTSRHLITGPMAATAALSAAAVADLVTDPSNVPAFTAAVAIVTGVLALLAGLCRLGFVANFISEPVLKGFIIGLALTIIIGQVPKLLGVDKGDGNFFEQLADVVREIPDTQWRALVIGLASLAIVIGLRRFAPAVPGSLVAVFFGIAMVQLFDLDAKGLSIVGPIQSGLPSFGLPDGLSVNDYLATGASSVGIALVGFAEGLGAAKTYATKFHYRIDTNRELIALGAANLGAGLASGMVVNGSLSKTAVNGSAGARSQLSAVLVAVMTVVTLLFLTGLFEELPDATLAAVVIAALVELVDFGALRDLYRLSTKRLGQIYGPAARPDFIAAMAAMFGVLIFDTLPGLFIGVISSILLLVYRASRPHVAELGQVPGAPLHYTDRGRHPDNVLLAGIAIRRVESGLWFANAETVRELLLDAADTPGTHAVILDAESTPVIDVTAVRMLSELADELATRNVTFAVARDIGQVRDMLRLAGDPDLRVYGTLQDAVDALTSP